ASMGFLRRAGCWNSLSQGGLHAPPEPCASPRSPVPPPAAPAPAATSAASPPFTPPRAHLRPGHCADLVALQHVDTNCGPAKRSLESRARSLDPMQSSQGDLHARVTPPALPGSVVVDNLHDHPPARRLRREPAGQHVARRDVQDRRYEERARG